MLVCWNNIVSGCDTEGKTAKQIRRNPRRENTGCDCEQHRPTNGYSFPENFQDCEVN